MKRVAVLALMMLIFLGQTSQAGWRDCIPALGKGKQLRTWEDAVAHYHTNFSLGALSLTYIPRGLYEQIYETLRTGDESRSIVSFFDGNGHLPHEVIFRSFESETGPVADMTILTDPASSKIHPLLKGPSIGPLFQNGVDLIVEIAKGHIRNGERKFDRDRGAFVKSRVSSDMTPTPPFEHAVRVSVENYSDPRTPQNLFVYLLYHLEAADMKAP